MNAPAGGFERRRFNRALPAVLVTARHAIGAGTDYVMQVGTEAQWHPDLDSALRAIYLHNIINGHAATPADLRHPQPTKEGTP